MKHLMTFLVFCVIVSQSFAQEYVNKAITTIGSGVLEGGNYKSIVSLGEPSGKGNVSEDNVYSISSGFIYVAEEPLKEVLGLQLSMKEYSLFPNPTERELHFKYSVDKPVKDLVLKITTLEGKRLVEQLIPAEKGDHQLSVNVDHLEQAVYVLSIQSSGSQFKMNMRFIKQ
ncbi:MAG: T9SS type A sorting domain-containing protein [Cyclobacteriaceae bacterium]